MAYLASSVALGVQSILQGLVDTCLSPSKQQPLILSITSFPLFETRLMIFSFIYCIFKSRYLDVDLFFTLCLCGNLGVCFVAEQQNNDIDKGYRLIDHSMIKKTTNRVLNYVHHFNEIYGIF